VLRPLPLSHVCTRTRDIDLCVCPSVHHISVGYCMETLVTISSPHINPIWSGFMNIKHIREFPTGLHHGGVECRWGRQKCDSPPISGFITCCQRFDRQVYTQLHRTVVSWWHSSQVSGVVCCLWETTTKCLWQKPRVDVTLKTTEQHLIVRSCKFEAEVTNKKYRARGIVLLKLIRQEACVRAWA